MHRDPTFEECLALTDAWADATLGYLNRLSCSDPLTGLDSQAHLLALLGVPSQADLRLVALEVPRPLDFFALAQELTLLGETCRSVFPHARVIARVGVRRVVVLTHAGPGFGTRVSLLTRCMGEDGRVLVEPVSSDRSAIEAVIDRLARA
ncbi:hypothetical protein [Nocardioides sp.]|uniref:hypothetical protein n=1 Tax=Nocardioides sp. TaxID=35761 RepID=UPI00356A9B88